MARDPNLAVRPTDTVERIQQILASLGVRVGRSTASAILREVSSAAASTPAPTADAYALRNQYTDTYAQPAAAPPERGGHQRGGSDPAKIRLLLDAMGLSRFIDEDRFKTVQAVAGYIYLQGGTIPDYLAAQLGIDLSLAESLAFMVRSLAPEASFPGIGGGNSAFLREFHAGEALEVEARRGAFERLLEASSTDEAQRIAVGMGATEQEAQAAVPPAPVSHEVLRTPEQPTPVEMVPTPAQAAATVGAGQVWIVGPDGNPMLATLSTEYVPPTDAAAGALPDMQTLIEQVMAQNPGISEEDALDLADQQYRELTVAAYNANQGETDALIGVPSGYVAYRDMPRYTPPELHPGGMAAGVGSRLAGVGAGEANVALEPRYRASFMGAYYSMSSDELATLQEGLVRAGLLDEGAQTGNPVDSHDAFVTLLATANWRGENYTDTLAWLVNTAGGAQLPTFKPSAYQPPDYDTLAESVYEIFARDLGRDPEEWEVRELADRFAGHYYQQYQSGLEAERRAFLEENNLPTGDALQQTQPYQSIGGGALPSYIGAQPPTQQQIDQARGYREQVTSPLPAAEDPYSSFMQYFRQHYRPEMDLRKQVANNSYGRDNLFQSIARMDTMMGGG